MSTTKPWLPHLFEGSYEGDGGKRDEWDRWEAGGFTTMCVLAGCDYLPSFRGVGIRSAHAAVRKHMPSLEDAVHALSQSSNHTPLGDELNQYVAKVRRALIVFTHAYVYDPLTRRIVHLSPLPSHTDWPIDYLGQPPNPSLAVKVCEEASLDPYTLQPHECTLHVHPEVVAAVAELRAWRHSSIGVGIASVAHCGYAPSVTTDVSSEASVVERGTRH